MVGLRGTGEDSSSALQIVSAAIAGTHKLFIPFRPKLRRTKNTIQLHCRQLSPKITVCTHTHTLSLLHSPLSIPLTHTTKMSPPARKWQGEASTDMAFGLNKHPTPIMHLALTWLIHLYQAA